MSENTPLVNVHVNINLPAACLQAVVSNWKKKSAQEGQGRHHFDTADALSELITRFLLEKNFEEYTKDESNY
jgi:hypothetical protein